MKNMYHAGRFGVPIGLALASLFGLLLFSTSSVAGARNRPARVTVRDIAPELGRSSEGGFVINPEDPRQIILPGPARVFRSFNGGRNWHPIDLLDDGGHTMGAVRIEGAPTNPNLLFAISGSDVYRSVDFGTTWTRIESGFSDVNDVALNEASSNLVLVLNSSAWDEEPLWKSVDGGVTFEPQPDSGLPKAIIDRETGEFVAFPLFQDVATTPADPSIVYVVQSDDETGYYPPSIYKSVDGGGTFARLEGGTPRPFRVFAHPTQPNVLFVLDDPLYRSVDGGTSFEPLMAGLPPGTRSVAFDAHNPSFVYVAGRSGVFRSTNGGDTFEPLGLTAEQLGLFAVAVSVDPSNARIIYVNTIRGNFKSVNGGITFRSINKGWRANLVNHITLDNAGNPSLYLAMQDGVGLLKTRTRGKHYEVVPNTAGGHSPSIIAVAPSNPDMILAGTRSGGLFRTGDGGRSWALASIDTGLIGFAPGSSEIEFDPLDPSHVYFAASDPLRQGEFSGFYRSTDAGVTFHQTLVRKGITGLAIDPIEPNVIYLGTHGLNGPSRSLDRGASFVTGPILQAFVDDIAIDPIHANTVYLAGSLTFSFEPRESHVVVRSTDGGETYTAADAGLQFSFPTQIHGIAIDPSNSARLYAWTDGGLFMTRDGATTWTLLEGDETVKAARFVGHIAIHPKKPNLLYLAGEATVLEVEVHDSKEIRDRLGSPRNRRMRFSSERLK